MVLRILKERLADCNEDFFIIESKKLEYKLDFSDMDICRLIQILKN